MDGYPLQLIGCTRHRQTDNYFRKFFIKRSLCKLYIYFFNNYVGLSSFISYSCYFFVLMLVVKDAVVVIFDLAEALI